VICGTSTGVLSLWDLRFGILIKSWKVGLAARARSVRIHQCLVHPTKGKGRWILVAMETDSRFAESESDTVGSLTTLVEVWDIENSTLVETFATRASPAGSEPAAEPQPVASEEAEMSPADAIAALVQARQEVGTPTFGSVSSRRRSGTLVGRGSREGALPRAPSPDVRAMIVGSDFGGHSTFHRTAMSESPEGGGRGTGGTRGFMISGSEDHRLRMWDFGRVDRCMVISGPDADGEKPSYSVVRSTSSNAATYVETWTNLSSISNSNRPSQRLSLVNHNQQNLLKSHQDVVTALLSLESPFRGGIVSGDRSGVLKVWRVEGMDGQ